MALCRGSRGRCSCICMRRAVNTKTRAVGIGAALHEVRLLGFGGSRGAGGGPGGHRLAIGAKRERCSAEQHSEHQVLEHGIPLGAAKAGRAAVGWETRYQAISI